MIIRRHLPWLIAAVLPVLAVLWWRDDTPPPEPEAPQVQAKSQVPQGLEPITPPSTQAPRPPDYYPPWPGDPRAGQAAPSEPPLEAYRFRPLSERERRRIEQQSAASYRAPQSPTRYQIPGDDWRRPYAPQPHRDLRREPMMQEPWQRSWGTEGYSFRPAAPSPRSNGRWQGPYAEPRVRDPYRASPLQPFDEGMQWGATPPRAIPPSHRMYPALEPSGGTSLTAL